MKSFRKKNANKDHLLFPLHRVVFLCCRLRHDTLGMATRIRWMRRSHRGHRMFPARRILDINVVLLDAVASEAALSKCVFAHTLR